MIMLVSLFLSPLVYLVIAAGLIGLGFSFWNYKQFSNNIVANAKIEYMASNTLYGVKTLRISRFILTVSVATLIALIVFIYYGKHLDLSMVISYIIGLFFSLSSFYISQYIAAYSSKFVLSETSKSYKAGFKKAFNSSVAAGLSNVSVFVIGIGINLIVIQLLSTNEQTTFLCLICFALGVSISSVLNRLSGDLLNRCAAIAEDELIRKHAKISATSMFNPLALVRNVGQLTSKISGISADVFNTLSIAVIAAILLGANMVTEEFYKSKMLVYLPLFIVSIGILTSITVSFFLKSDNQNNSKFAMRFAENFAAVILLLSTFVAVKFLLPKEWIVESVSDNETIKTTYYRLGIFWSALIGVTASIGLGYINNLFSNHKRYIPKEIARLSMKGFTYNNLSCTRMSFLTAGIPFTIIVIVALSSYYLANFYGMAIAAVAFIGNIALHQSFGAFAAVARISENIASKSYLDKETLKNANLLRREGSIKISKLKMYLLTAASLSVLAMFGNFIEFAHLKHIDIAKPLILSALAVGALIPVLLSFNILGAIKRLSKIIIKEAEQQITDSLNLEDVNSALLKNRGNIKHADNGEKETVHKEKLVMHNNKSVKKSARMSFYEMLTSTVIMITTVSLLGIFGGTEIIASLLVGLMLSSFIIAAYGVMKGMLSASTKNTVEAGFVSNGDIIDKSSPAYEVAIANEQSSKALSDVLAPTAIMLVKIALIVSMVLLPVISRNISISKTIHIERLE